MHPRIWCMKAIIGRKQLRISHTFALRARNMMQTTNLTYNICSLHKISTTTKGSNSTMPSLQVICSHIAKSRNVNGKEKSKHSIQVLSGHQIALTRAQIQHRTCVFVQLHIHAFDLVRCAFDTKINTFLVEKSYGCCEPSQIPITLSPQHCLN